jgi:hypothetical protein
MSVQYFLLKFVALVIFRGVIVRLRANYTPKSIGGGDLKESTKQSNQEPPVGTSLWGMFWRVRRIEGWIGLLKGFSRCFTAALSVRVRITLTSSQREVPTLLEMFASGFLGAGALGILVRLDRDAYTLENGRIFRAILSHAFSLLASIPFIILTNRYEK